MNCLNLGCGKRLHSDWVNVDYTASNENVISHDLSRGIPFPDNSFDVVYHSHLLEHFPRSAASVFVQSCWRVLKPGGILRVVVPNLEQIAKVYLEALEKASQGSEEWAANYEWMMLEMYDQTVRNYSGGAMAEYLYGESIPNEAFVVERCGSEASELIKAGKEQRKVMQKNDKSLPRRAISMIGIFIQDLSHVREVILRMLLGKERDALKVGRFRMQGEIHQWMYDRYSLKLLLENCRFSQIVERTAYNSYITDWARYNLDTESDGAVYKPDSLFMEGIKSRP